MKKLLQSAKEMSTAVALLSLGTLGTISLCGVNTATALPVAFSVLIGIYLYLIIRNVK